MNRQEKETLISQLRDGFQNNEAAFLVSVKGLTVTQLQGLRRNLVNNGGKLKVAKVRLVKLAIKDVPGVQDFDPFLKEQLAVVFAKNEPTSVAKILNDFSKKNNLDLVAGCFESRVLDKDQVSFIASLPSREVLISQLLGVLNSPVVRLVSVLNNIIAKPIVVLKQIGEKK